MSEENSNTIVLIVEDDIQYGKMLEDALTTFKYSTRLVFSVTSAIDTIRREKIDIILSDINMPGIGGIDLTTKIRDMYLDTPIIMVTGVHDMSVLKDAMNAGANDYLQKPVKLDELPVVIERNLHRYLQEKAARPKDREHTLLQAITALMRALDAKDSYTFGHSQRVVKLAMLMADELQLSSEERFTLQLAAALHDIGKIGMPDSILNKADGLEDIEMSKAKAHPVIGSKILGEIEELKEVASIVRHHHERYDGTGYPDNLQGEAIPYYSRMLAIIDAFEALVSDRVYHKGLSRPEALREIERSAGSQFDPALSKTFCHIIHKNNGEHLEPETKLSLNFEDLNTKQVV